MEHCLVFGSRGHLAKTRIIPALKKLNCPYTPISRQKISNLEHLKDVKNVIAYMAIPTHNFCENVEPYLNTIKPTYILEKPHGHSKFDFDRITDYIHTNDMNVIYNDHYLGKDILRDIELPEKIECIKIRIRETDDMNERIKYFDTVGIVGDMYQSHCVIIFATIISKYLGVNRKDVLREIAWIEPELLHLSRNIEYIGTAPTRCIITMKYKDILLEADVAKMVAREEKTIFINDEPLDMNTGKDAYENIFDQIICDNKNFFLSENEIIYLWNHISLMRPNLY